MADDPLTIAQNAARGFQLLQCEECARAVRSALKAAGFGGTWIELRVGSGRDYIVCLSYDGGQTPITLNGRHLGVRVAGRVVDNLHPEGVPLADWLADFVAPGGVFVYRTEDFGGTNVSHIVRLLNELRKRPGMYIGAPLLSRLAFFLRGYDLGAEQVGGAKPDPFLSEFREWIYGRFGLVNRSWEDLIIDNAGGGDREGFDRFWLLYDEYLAESKNGVPVVEQQHGGSQRVEHESRS